MVQRRPLLHGTGPWRPLPGHGCWRAGGWGVENRAGQEEKRGGGKVAARTIMIISSRGVCRRPM